MNVHIFDEQILKEFTEKLIRIAAHSESIITESYKIALAEMPQGCLTNKQINKLLDEMQQQMCDNETSMQVVLLCHYDFFKGLIEKRLLADLMAEIFEKKESDFKKKTTSGFHLGLRVIDLAQFRNKLAEAQAATKKENTEKIITASEAREIAKKNQRDFDCMKKVSADIRRLSFEGKYRHSYLPPNPTTATVVLEKLKDLGYKLQAVKEDEQLYLEISWD